MMSRIIIFAVLSIASAALAEFDYRTCETLNVIKHETHLLKSDEFVKKLDRCSDALNHNVSLTIGTIALLKVRNAFHRDQKCTFTREMENKLIECVTTVTHFKKNEFTVQAAKEHFGLNTTEAIVFKTKQCKSSEKLAHCVQEKFSAEKLSREMTYCKDINIRGFNETAFLCQEYVNHLDKNLGRVDLPSNISILGAAAMLAKFGMFSRY